MSCQSYRYDNILSIELLADNTVTWKRPWNHTEGIKRFITTGTGNDVQFSATYPISASPTDAKLEVSSKDNRAGTLYTCTLKFNMLILEDNQDSIEGQLETLKTPHHVLLTFIGGAQGIIRMCEPASGYKFRHRDTDGQIQCELNIANLAGMQRIKQ